MNKGKIVQVSGPVVDVEFSDGELPCVKDALEVDNHGKRCVMEVAQHIGDNTVRCVMRRAVPGDGGYSDWGRDSGAGRRLHAGTPV